MSSVPAERAAKDAVAVQSGGGSAAAPARGRGGNLLRLLLPTVTLAVVLAAWQAGLVHKLLGLQPYTLAYPSDIVATLRTQTGTLLPDMVQADARPGVVVRAIAGGEVHRTIVAATRRADRERPSVQALLAAVRAAALSVAAGDRAAARAGG